MRLAVADQVQASIRLESDGDLMGALRRLECAHVFSQSQARLHLGVHWSMAVFAIRRRDWRELLGQVPRGLLAAPASWTGLAPRGNTGGATVSLFTLMARQDDLESLLNEVR